MLIDTQAAEVQSATTAQGDVLLSIRSARKRFGQVEVLCGISLDVYESEFLTILGESGSGKTTLLRLVAGFEQLDGGEIWMEGSRLDALPAYRRRVNTVFQHYALFPHLTVFENIAYGMRVQGVARTEIPGRVAKALEMVKMEAFAQSKPAKISGGQQQRVALARALVNRPRMLLLDEPLSALDANLRRQMQGELKALQREVGITFLFVTHDQDEAMALSDRIALLRAGQLEQIATPQKIYRHPASSYVARFIGQTNILSCVVQNGRADCGAFAWNCGGEQGRALFSVRPESIRLCSSSEPPSPGAVRFSARVVDQMFQGATDVARIECPNGLELTIRLASGTGLNGNHEFEFPVAAAVRINEEGP
jgi:spermidine/putrescine transport system ATP-binding protein